MFVLGMDWNEFLWVFLVLCRPEWGPSLLIKHVPVSHEKGQYCIYLNTLYTVTCKSGCFMVKKKKKSFDGVIMESRGSFQLENSHRSRDTDILLSGKTVLHKLSSFLSNKMMSVK